ncbi:homeobox-leucine zipper protein HAT7 isoform X2 [Cryptomeria japonica]|uniref:homeobox-leucine zipper protein HAT7 isoform X2 n=1 Tax=Cryptomeria japonica TaxID=3369 RepID=UPI0027DA8F70|nr:homeobox-leucine zipper protein HAT7 isoform X2 [Cryptomeria japonica]
MKMEICNNNAGLTSIGDYESAEKTRKRLMAATACRNLSDDNLWEEDGILDDTADKKTKLTLEQAKVLEKSFEEGNKLDHDRKMELSRTLGLQPKRIAVWFQNRRARWKAKQLEKDYKNLKQSYNALKTHYDVLLQERTNFKDEAKRLKRELVDKNESNFNGRDSDHQSQQNSTALFHQSSTSPTEMVITSWEACEKDSQQGGCSSEGSSVKPYTLSNSEYGLMSDLLAEQPDYSPQILPKVVEESMLKNGGVENCNNLFCSCEEQGSLLWRY